MPTRQRSTKKSGYSLPGPRQFLMGISALALFIALGGSAVGMYLVQSGTGSQSQAAGGIANPCRTGAHTYGNCATDGCAKGSKPVYICQNLRMVKQSCMKWNACPTAVTHTTGSCNAPSGRGADCPCGSSSDCASNNCVSRGGTPVKYCVGDAPAPQTGTNRPTSNAAAQQPSQAAAAQPAAAQQPAQPAANTQPAVEPTPATCAISFYRADENGNELPLTAQEKSKLANGQTVDPYLPIDGEMAGFRCAIASGGPVEALFWAVYRINFAADPDAYFADPIAAGAFGVQAPQAFQMQVGDVIDCAPFRGGQLFGSKCSYTVPLSR